MPYKALIATVILAFSVFAGLSGVRRVTSRRSALVKLYGGVRALRFAAVEGGMTLAEAFSRGPELFRACARETEAHPGADAEKVAAILAENGCFEAFLKSDEEAFIRFLTGAFRSACAEELSNVITAYAEEIDAALKEIDGELLKKARLKRTLTVLAGAAAAVIVI